MSTTTVGPTIEERTAILDREVAKYVKKGFRVISRSDTTAQLVKPKRFSLFWAFVWFLALGVGLIFYIFWYMSKRDETVYLEVDEKGKVRRR